MKNVVIVGVFSPLASSGTQEEYVKKIIEEELEHNVNVVCSKDGNYFWHSIITTSYVSFSRPYRLTGTRERGDSQCFHSHICSNHRSIIPTSTEIAWTKVSPVSDSGTPCIIITSNHNT